MADRTHAWLPAHMHGCAPVYAERGVSPGWCLLRSGFLRGRTEPWLRSSMAAPRCRRCCMRTRGHRCGVTPNGRLDGARAREGAHAWHVSPPPRLRRLQTSERTGHPRVLAPGRVCFVRSPRLRSGAGAVGAGREGDRGRCGMQGAAAAGRRRAVRVRRGDRRSGGAHGAHRARGKAGTALGRAA